MAEEVPIKNIQSKIKSSWNERYEITIEALVHPDVTTCLEQNLDIRTNSDLLILSINNHNILQLLWYKSVVKRFLHYAKHPYLIVFNFK
jgi:hypothetical protein